MIDRLRKGLSLSVQKTGGRDKPRNTATLVETKSGNTYISGIVESDNHLLDISSEQGALTRAIHNIDYEVVRVTTLVDNSEGIVSPMVMKILADFSTRTKTPIAYTVIDTDENVIFEISDVLTSIPFYNPPRVELSILSSRSGPSQNTANNMQVEQLKTYAVAGVERNFPTYDSASGYGVALLTKDGTIYFGGQYSSFEKRTNLHAEMAVITSALMDGSQAFTHLGIVSTKFKNDPCHICGCCRQFISELQNKLDFRLSLMAFAYENDTVIECVVDDLLPSPWTNKK